MLRFQEYSPLLASYFTIIIFTTATIFTTFPTFQVIKGDSISSRIDRAFKQSTKAVGRGIRKPGCLWGGIKQVNFFIPHLLPPFGSSITSSILGFVGTILKSCYQSGKLCNCNSISNIFLIRQNSIDSKPQHLKYLVTWCLRFRFWKINSL